MVVIPTYNEKGNVEAIVAAVHRYLECDVLIVDDGSPDGTGELADRMAANDERVHVMHRQGKQGLGTAYIAGFRFAMDHGFERVCEMDADFSHAPWDLPRLVHASHDAELVIGSRYVRGGCTVGWDFRRRMLSRGANLYARMMLSSGVRDNTAGFRCFHVDALRKLDLDAVHAQGYAFQIEMAFRIRRRGFAIKEIPIHFIDRRVGQSKMDGA
ncbi:MAG TPA: polyprenol monophosphomannose synthase, partial [bacterium]|nr:polyprenol monophosphomannose synthase [bacterium]